MGQLTRRLNPFTLFLLSINGIVGSGWLFAPLYAAKIAGPNAIISWMIGGFAATLIAFTYAELSTMFPVAGGTAHIPQLSHGTFVSFILGWIAWLTALLLTPIEVQAVLQYAALFFPSLMNEVNHVPTLTLYGYMWAAILMVLLCLINIMSYRGLVRFNFVLCIFKFSVIFVTILAILRAQFHVNNFSTMFTSLDTPSGWQSIFSAVATGGIVLAFNGFKSGVELAGETKKLAVAIPLSTAGSVLACLFLYLGLQICFIGALDANALKNGWQHLSADSDMGPFVILAVSLGLFWLLKLLYINAVISPLGAGLIYVTATARILYAMSRIGYAPKFLSRVNKQQLPVWAIVVNFVIGMFTFLPLPGWQAMANFLISGIVITYAMGPISLMCLRLSLPESKRPFKLPAASLVSFVAFYFCNLFSYWTGWHTMSKLSILLVLGFVIFFIGYYRGMVKVEKEEFKSITWVVPYLLGLVLISYLGSFGGMGVIPFGWDFLVIGLFSVCIFQLAIQTRIKRSMEEVSEFLLNEAALAHKTE